MNEIEIIEFPKSFIEYREYYSSFCRILGLMEKREEIKRLKDGVIIEIRNKEGGHKAPHIHAKYQGRDISISLVDASILAGNIPAKNKKIAVEWVKENLDILREKWNNKHTIIKYPDVNAIIPEEWLLENGDE